jgi:shikimate kinase
MPPTATPSLILLIGYRGSGKSASGRHLASQLGYQFVDSDDVIEHRSGRTIAQIFDDQGETAFRDLEQEVVTQLCTRQRTVVALGGGAVLRAENRRQIGECGGIIVWLAAGPSTLLRRTAADSRTASRRPPLTRAKPEAEVERLLHERTPLYRACATFKVDTEHQDPAAVAAEILRRLPGK